jgi:hypothetical protein
MRMQGESFGGFPTKDSPLGPQLPPAEAFFYTPERWMVEAGLLHLVEHAGFARVRCPRLLPSCSLVRRVSR